VEDHPKLAEFRDNNRDLNRQVSTLKEGLAKFEGIDPSEVMALRTRLRDFEGLDPQKAREALGAAQKAADLEQALKTERQAKGKIALEHEVALAALKLGVVEDAVPLVQHLAHAVFAVGPGGEVATVEMSPMTPGVPLSVAEWVTQQQQAHPYLFKPSKGGGASNLPGPPPSRPVVSRHDGVAFGQNLEAIASGRVGVD